MEIYKPTSNMKKQTPEVIFISVVHMTHPNHIYTCSGIVYSQCIRLRWEKSSPHKKRLKARLEELCEAFKAAANLWENTITTDNKVPSWPPSHQNCLIHFCQWHWFFNLLKFWSLRSWRQKITTKCEEHRGRAREMMTLTHRHNGQKIWKRF